MNQFSSLLVSERNEYAHKYKNMKNMEATAYAYARDQNTLDGIRITYSSRDSKTSHKGMHVHKQGLQKPMDA